MPQEPEKRETQQDKDLPGHDNHPGDGEGAGHTQSPDEADIERSIPIKRTTHPTVLLLRSNSRCDFGVCSNLVEDVLGGLAIRR